MENTLRILITGSRDYSDKKRMEKIFANVMKKYVGYDEYILISGACPRGADRMAENICESLGWTVETYPADWNKHGKGAGHIRNQTMVDTGADFCLASPTSSSRGTWDCIRRAEKAQIPTKVFQ